MTSVPANWYPDPEYDGYLRYWNGVNWTDDRVPASPATVVEQPDQGIAQDPRVPLLGTRAYAKRQSQELSEALAENQRLRAELTRTGALELADMHRLREQIAAQIASESAQLEGLRTQVIETREMQVLQEIGIYEYRHPLSDAVAYRELLSDLQSRIKFMARRDGGAIEASTTWNVNGSVTEGRKMVREVSMLMLRAYNAEADNLVRALKPYKLPTALERLDKLAFTIQRMGKTMQLRIAPQYHGLRRYELELTADYLAKVAQQKQQERDERDRLREERRVHEELARERKSLAQQQQRFRDELTVLEEAHDTESARALDLQAKLAALEEAIQSVDYRAAHIRAGYVYVISNVGAFGDDVVQIGLTRRYDPWDRIRDLNNMSVPFQFDVHTMFFAQDAVTVEDELHRRLADKRVNHVNLRREFFYATPAEVREHLQDLTNNTLLEFNDLAEAVEYHQSLGAVKARRDGVTE